MERKKGDVEKTVESGLLKWQTPIIREIELEKTSSGGSSTGSDGTNYSA